MFSIILLILATHGIAVSALDEQWYPRLMSSDGNLVIRPAKNRNITLDVYGSESFVNIGQYEVLHLLSSAERATQTLLALEQSTSSSPNIEVQKIQNVLNGRNGVLSRLTKLERRNGTSAFQTYSPIRRINSFLRNRIRRIQNRVTTLETALKKNECASTPCKNGGTCIDGYNTFVCLCPLEWQGGDCSIDVNECDRFANTGLGCQNQAVCKNKEGGYECVCATGWYGIHCTLRTSSCVGENSELCGHGICRNSTTGNSYTCDCEQGWKTDGHGPACTVDIDECSGRTPCSTNPYVPCINTPGSFYCGSCPSGYTGNGFTCVDIDECLTNNGGCSKSPLVQCINTVGYRICGPCPPGYEGDGTSCTFKGLCQVNNGGCSPMAKCEENPSISWTYVKCTCPAGYTGHGFGIAGCTVSSSNAVSTNTELPSIHCNPNPCIHGTCVDVPTGHLCICHTGFTGAACERLADACFINPCRNGGTCLTATEPPGYRCECSAQFSGNRCQNPASQCGEVLNKEEGSIIYPVANNTMYRHNSRCAWVIKTKPNLVLNVTFTNFNLEKSSGCLFDWLQIHDGLNSADRVIGRFCGNTLPNGGNIITTSNSLYFWFRSDHTVAHNGFSLFWKSIPPVCGGDIVTTTHGTINSPGSPGKYPPNRDCIWTIQAPPGKRVLLHFFTMQIESGPGCANDYLEIREGHSLTDPLLMIYCNSTSPPPFTSPGSQLMVHFHSDGEINNYGFQMTYSVVEGIPGCGGTYTQDVGEITPPSVNGKYAVNIVCEYLIKLPPGTKMKITFLKFDLEDSSTCQFDYLAAYDGATENSDLIGKYCGTTIPNSFVSDSNKVLLVFKSDWSFASKGFRLRYSLVCREVFREPNGLISSPGYPKSYKGNRKCTYLIRQPPRKAIKLTFIDFDVEDNNFPECNYDNVKIYDGDTNNSTLMGNYCGELSSLPDQFVSTLNFLLIEFTSDESVAGRGFQANYTTIDLNCGAILKKSSGIISLPDPETTNELEYENDMSCTWIISAPIGFVIQLTWISFDVEYITNCLNDYVIISDRTEVLGRFCGTNSPPDLTSLSNTLNITFVSDVTHQSNGFSVSYNHIDPRRVCGGYYTSSYGTITSPGWPKGYPAKKDCTWTIHVPNGQQILLNFTTFSLENYTNCIADYLEIRNGGFANAPLIGKYCGEKIPKTIPSITNSLFIKFHSDQSRSSAGFHVTWESTATGCGGTLTSPIGSITSPNYPQPYGHNMECYWKISTRLGSHLELVFPALDLEKNCHFDFVEIFDSVDQETTSLGRFCSQSSSPPHIVSSSNHVYVKFHSDYFVAGTGFMLNYHTVCNRNITGYSGVIESPNFPDAYPSNIDCTWRIIVAKGNKINITFSHFDLESNKYSLVLRNTTITLPNSNFTFNLANNIDKCGYDLIEIKDGNGKYIDHQYCGKKIPPKFSSSDNTVFVHFKTDNYLEYSGFRLEWNIVGCGGKIKRPEGVIRTPGYPKNYPVNTECTWIIEVEPDKAVSLIIKEFDTEVSSDCTDSLIIYNGQDNQSPELSKLCHRVTIPVKLTSTGRYMHIAFKSDESFSGRGLDASFTSIESKCGGKYVNTFGSFSSTNYPKNYEKNSHCFWNIETLNDQRVVIIFEEFDLNDQRGLNGTCMDFVNIYDGDEPLKENLIAEKLCGNNLDTKLFVSKSNKVLVEMETSSLLTAKGFKAKYSMSCGSTIHAKSEGFIKLDRYMSIFQRYNICSWTIIADEADQKISLTFTYLDTIGDNSEAKALGKCLPPKMSIYNGESNKAPLMREICFDKAPPTILSEGNTITIELVNPIYNLIQLFEAHYSVLSTACGGNLMVEHGSFTSPMYPSTYPTNSECVWTFSPSPGNKISFTFIEFDIEVSENCDQDYLEVREIDGAGKLLGIFCGNTLPTNITAGTSLWVKFHSDSDGTSKGFYADFSYKHGNELFGDTGTIANPMYPRAYKASVDKGDFYWKINVPFGSKIRIKFKEISMALYEECDESNSVFVYDGVSEKAPLLITACGYELPEAAETASNVAYITWTSTGITLGSKFLLEWTSIEIPFTMDSSFDDFELRNTSCGHKDIIYMNPSSEHLFASPGYPNGYSTNLECTWKFETDSLNHIGLEFIAMNLEESDSCFMDKVSVLSATYKSDNELKPIGDYCLANATREVIDAGSLMNVKFTADMSGNGTGFSAKAYTKCGGNSTSPDGILTASYPNITGFYPKRLVNPLVCEWSIKVRPGRTIKLEFININITDTRPTLGTSCGNYLMLRNGGSRDSPILGKGKYCGTENPTEELETIGNLLFVKFYSVLRYPIISNANNFMLKYSEKSILCDYRMSLTDENNNITISTPNYPDIPNPFTECTWIIMAPVGERIKVDFVERFDLTPDLECENEFVEVRDGGTDMSDSIGKFCYRKPSTIKTSNNIVFIRFLTNVNDPKNGFKATVSTDICGGTINGDKGSIVLPKNLPVLNQKMDIECEWNIIGPATHSLWVNIRKLSLPYSFNCTNAYFELIDTTPINDTSLGTNMTERICTLDSPLSVRTMSEHAKLKLFIAKQKLTGFHFEMLVTFNSSLSVCGGTLSTPEGFLLGPSYRSNNIFSRFCTWRIQVPNGRRISLEVLSGLPETQKIHDFDLRIAFYSDYEFQSIIKTNFTGENRLVESSGNRMMVYYWSRSVPPSQFRAKYTSEKASICDGDFSQSDGTIIPPLINSQGTPLQPYFCVYTYSANTNEEPVGPVFKYSINTTLVLKMENVTIGQKVGHACRFSSSRISVSSPYISAAIPLMFQEFCGNYSKPIYVRTPYMRTRISINDNKGDANYKITYDTMPCGGIIKNVETGYELKIPEKDGPIDCVWLLIPTPGARIEGSTKNLKLTGPCDEEYVAFQKQYLLMSPMAIMCSTNITTISLKPPTNAIRVEYHADKFFKNSKLDVDIIAKSEGCGGLLKFKKQLSTPNFPSAYGANEECTWELNAEAGFRITLYFENRFALEKSENCSKDFVEVFDFRDENWLSIGRMCGRDLPKELNSTSNKMKVLFRSDATINGDGFQAKWKTFCGGELIASRTAKTLVSPGYPLYARELKCKYKIKGPEGEFIRLNFESFVLEDGRNNLCEFDNVTIDVDNDGVDMMFTEYTPQLVFCGTKNPGSLRFRNGVNLQFNTDRWLQRSGFVMKYEIDVCGGNINSSQKIVSPKTSEGTYESNCDCHWNITAPPDKIILLRFEKFVMEHSMNCGFDYLTIYDGYEEDDTKRLSQMCGNHTKALPVIKSTSNKMIMKMITDMSTNYDGFEVNVIFTYGESYGCGGKYEVMRKKPINFVIDKDKLYKPFMDCHWLLTTNESDVISLKFDSFHIAPCLNVNQTSLKANNCSCDYIEVRDGSGFSASLIGRYCGHDLPVSVTSSSNKMWLRFSTDGTVESTGIQATITSKEGVCGTKVISVSSNMTELMSPKNPDGSLMRGIRCSWKIESTMFAHMHLRFKNFDLSPPTKDGLCLDDKFEMLTEWVRVPRIPFKLSSFRRGNMFDEIDDVVADGESTYNSFFSSLGKKNKNVYCGRMNVSDYHSDNHNILITLITAPVVQGKFSGFVLDFIEGECSRNYTNDHGKISVSNSPETCTILINTVSNSTISLYLTSVSVMASDKNRIDIRDGPNSDSPLITSIKSFVIPPPIFSTTNVLRIESFKQTDYHYLSFEGQYISSDKGRGCGGRTVGDSGMISSPLYPVSFREETQCEWEITSPVDTVISLKFKMFDLGADVSCELNYVEIFEQDGSSMVKYCARDVPAVRTSNRNYVKIVQKASLNNKGSGWLLEYNAVYE